MTVAIYTDYDDAKKYVDYSTYDFYSWTANHIKTLEQVDYSSIDFYSWSTKQEFIQSEHTFKIAVLEPDFADYGKFYQICMDSKSCDLVVIHSIELNQEISSIMKKFDLSNFVFIVAGTLNFKLQHAKVMTDLTLVHSIARYYATNLQQLIRTRLTPYIEKQFKFDVLYGKPRLHRKFVKNYLLEFDDRPWFYQSPGFDAFNNANKGHDFKHSEFWEDEIILSDLITSSSQLIQRDHSCVYHNTSMQISQVLPFKVYNKTNYSLVCDTCFDNDYSFYSEKIAKPIIANRLFIAISGQYYLKNLKSLGFKTFDSIIDESYDNVLDHRQRWTMALEQAIWLCQQDTAAVLKKIRPILSHNADMINRLESTHLSQVVSEFLTSNGYGKT